MFEGVNYEICVNIDDLGNITSLSAGYGASLNGNYQYIFTAQQPGGIESDFIIEKYKVENAQLVLK